MSEVRVEDVGLRREGGAVELSARIRVAGAAREIWLRTDAGPVSGAANPFLAVALLPAMRLGLPLRLEGPVSPRVLAGSRRVQQTFSAWEGGTPLVEVSAAATQPSPAAAGRGVAAFFTGGVDSFYTVLRHRHELSHLLFVHGLDIRLKRTAFRERVARALRASAAELGLGLVEVETNLRSFGNRQVRWAEDQFGAALAAVALFLEPRFEKVLVPSSRADAFLLPCGSHPGLDRHWSSEALELVHDDCGPTRFEKIEALAAFPPALRALRVCWQFESEDYNCCRCLKCVFSMAMLRACGALERAETFHLPLDLELLASTAIMYPDEHMRLLLALDAIERRGGDPPLERALRAAIAAGVEAKKAKAP
jgi:hypothetical protein